MNTKCQIEKEKFDSIAQTSSKIKSKKPNKVSNSQKKFEDKNVEQIDLIASSDKKVIDRIGQLTRNLHDSLRELGYDKRLEAIASEVPEAQDKLSYVASKTEQAAERTLNATEIAMPIQDKLSTEAILLSKQWKEALETQQAQTDTEIFKLLLIDTLAFLDNIPAKTTATNTQLLEIMMAQDFQDLTGQVIKKITHMVQSLEKDLIDLLLANVAAKNKPMIADGLLNGPVTNPEKRDDIVCNQDQVDDLLASLGF